MRLVFDNAMLYNPATDRVHEIAKVSNPSAPDVCQPCLALRRASDMHPTCSDVCPDMHQHTRARGHMCHT
eukprot:3230175-Rhodomonas_salina.1